MRLSRNFTSTEFECPCCGRSEMDAGFIKRLQKARSKARMPFRINSGFRCVKHNATVGGVPTSSHLRGLAADISCRDSSKRYKIIEALMWAGLTRIGVADTFIHVDSDTVKRSPTMWTY